MFYEDDKKYDLKKTHKILICSRLLVIIFIPSTTLIDYEIPFGLGFCAWKYGSICILLHVDIQLCQHHLLKMLFFPLYNFSFFVKNQVFIGVQINIQVFDLIPLVHLSVFMPILICFQYCSSIIDLDVRDGDASGSPFIGQDCFGYPGFLFFHIKLSIVLSRSVNNCVGILLGTTLILYIQRGCHFYYVDSTYPSAWKIFLFSAIFFSFFLQSLKVLVEVFHFFG